MAEIFFRTEMLLGEKAMNILSASRVAVFGVGGVGGYCVEALARSGVGTLDLIDNDTVALSNINRQIIALHSTVGEYKTAAAKKRALDINPGITVNEHRIFYMPGTEFDFSACDYVVDAIDTVTGKIAIIENAKKAGIPVISSMGAGNKLDPTAFEVADIYKTSVCPLARVMRYELRRRGIKDVKAVFSKEQPVSVSTENDKRYVPASIAFVPSAAGLIIAGEVIKDLIKGADS